MAALDSVGYDDAGTDLVHPGTTLAPTHRFGHYVGYHRGDPAWPATGGHDADGADSAVCRGVDRAAAVKFLL